MQNYKIVITFLILSILAAGLRFYKLGEWSHGFDENYTTMEARYFFEGQPIPAYMFKSGKFDPEKSQFSRLPRLLVASYFVNWIDYRLFGDDEFGSRVLMAVMGSLCVGIVFLLGYSLFGFSGSLILALLILLFPEHILQSQDNRFYSQAFLCISIVLLLGAHVAVKHSVTAAVWLGPMAVLMVFTHSLAGLIWGFLLLSICADFILTKRTGTNNRKLPPKLILILGFWSLILLGIAVFHILPLAKSWNNFGTSSVSSIHSVFGLALNLGWFFFMFFIPAWFFLLFNFRQSGNTYWFTCVTLCGLSVLLLPLKIAYISHYNFLFIFPFFVVLAVFFDWIYRLIICSKIPHARILGLIWIFFILCSHFLSLVDYYQNGSRSDYRGACQYLREHWQPEDQLICFHRLNVNRYIPDLEPKFPLEKTDTITCLQTKVEEMKTGRLWILVLCNRYEPEEGTRYWLYNNTKYQTQFGKKLLTTSGERIELFLYLPQQNIP